MLESDCLLTQRQTLDKAILSSDTRLKRRLSTCMTDMIGLAWSKMPRAPPEQLNRDTA